MQNLLQNSVEITVNVEESRLAEYQKLSEDYGVLQFSISKPLKFEDLGLAPMDDGQFQCLACSKIFKGKEILESFLFCMYLSMYLAIIVSWQVAAGSNQIFTGSIDGVDNIVVKSFECCFLRQILTTVTLKIEKCGLRVLIWAEVQPLIDVLALP